MADFTEKTPVKLPMKVFLYVIGCVAIAVIFIAGIYSGLTGADKEIKEKMELKADKREFEKHCYSDSLRFDYFMKDIKKDLRDIKRNLKIKEDKE